MNETRSVGVERVQKSVVNFEIIVYEKRQNYPILPHSDPELWCPALPLSPLRDSLQEDSTCQQSCVYSQFMCKYSST